MTLIKAIGNMMDVVQLKQSINQVRFWVTRPKWWKDERVKIRFYSQFVRPGQLCFDVGANVGQYTSLILKLGASVVAVEPQPWACERFREQHGESILTSRVTLVEAAVSSSEGTAEIYCPYDGSTLSSMSKDWIEQVKHSGRFEGSDWSRSVAVKATTLDSLIGRYGLPVLCKIDVEGFEPEVLKGLTRPIRYVSFEYTPENTGHIRSCVNQLMKLGPYRFNLSLHDHYRFYWPDWQSGDDAVNYLEQATSHELQRGGDVYARLPINA